MQLNKIPVLDKGFVAGISFSMSSKTLSTVQSFYFKSNFAPQLYKFANATLILKCPLFINMFLSRYDFKTLTLNANSDDGLVETYVPNESEIGATDVVTSQNIKESIEQAAEALKLSSEGFVMDGCDNFIAQVNLPISVYNEIMVSGSLESWLRLTKQKNLPKPIESYRQVIEDILRAQWPNLKQMQQKVV